MHDDEDSALIVQFENAVVDSVQEDRELSAFFSSYQEARKRLVEKTRSRGFWSHSKGKGSFEKRALENRKEKGSDPSHWHRELQKAHAGAVKPQAIGRPSVH
mgnify:CR=1 FL=1